MTDGAPPVRASPAPVLPLRLKQAQQLPPAERQLASPPRQGVVGSIPTAATGDGLPSAATAPAHLPSARTAGLAPPASSAQGLVPEPYVSTSATSLALVRHGDGSAFAGTVIGVSAAHPTPPRASIATLDAIGPHPAAGPPERKPSGDGARQAMADGSLIVEATVVARDALGRYRLDTPIGELLTTATRLGLTPGMRLRLAVQSAAAMPPGVDPGMAATLVFEHARGGKQDHAAPPLFAPADTSAGEYPARKLDDEPSLRIRLRPGARPMPVAAAAADPQAQQAPVPPGAPFSSVLGLAEAFARLTARAGADASTAQALRSAAMSEVHEKPDLIAPSIEPPHHRPDAALGSAAIVTVLEGEAVELEVDADDRPSRGSSIEDGSGHLVVAVNLSRIGELEVHLRWAKTGGDLLLVSTAPLPSEVGGDVAAVLDRLAAGEGWRGRAMLVEAGR